MTALGGAVWQSPGKLGTVINTGLLLRKQFALACLAVMLPIVYYLFRQQPISTLGILIILACLIPTFVTTLTSGLYKVVPQLHQRIKSVVRINAISNSIRIATAVLPLLAFPFAAVALIGTGLAQYKGNRDLRRLMDEDIVVDAPTDPKVKRELLGFVKRILPTSIYYALSGQLTIWLLSIFGTTSSIAQVGALTRLMVVFTLVSLTVDLLVVPRFARLPKDSTDVLSRFFQSVAVGVAIGGTVIAAVLLVPDLLLAILGSTYEGLDYELLLVSISSSLWMLTNLISKLGAARSIIPNPIGFIGTQIVVQVVLVGFVIDYTELTGVLYLAIWTVVSTLLYRIIHFFVGMSRENTSRGAGDVAG